MTTVAAGQPMTRPAGWRALLRHGVGTGRRLSEVLARKISAAFDPRARLLRQRRRALRWGLIFTAACVFWVLVTTLLASWSTPVWVLLVTGLIAAGAASPATLLLLRYRWLRSLPLPAHRPGAARRLPPLRSAAHPPMAALDASERGLFALLGVLERGRLLPGDEISELAAAARRSAAAIAVTAEQVVSMEQAARHNPAARDHLIPTINAFTAQLRSGVHQYSEMVTAAAQLVASAGGELASDQSDRLMPADSDSPVSQRYYRDELTGATDRLLGWAQAFDELSPVAAGRAVGLERRA